MDERQVCNQIFFSVRKPKHTEQHESVNQAKKQQLQQQPKKSYCNVNRREKPSCMKKILF